MRHSLLALSPPQGTVQKQRSKWSSRLTQSHVAIAARKSSGQPASCSALYENFALSSPRFFPKFWGSEMHAHTHAIGALAHSTASGGPGGEGSSRASHDAELGHPSQCGLDLDGDGLV